MTDKVTMSNRRPFGGSRIAGGTVSVDLWTDGVVLGTAWTTAQPEIAGTLFTFRGTLRRSAPWLPRSAAWRLVDSHGAFVATFPTRQAVLDAVEAKCVLDAFTALNRAEAAR
jgi:hypothetical protein